MSNKKISIFIIIFILLFSCLVLSQEVMAVTDSYGLDATAREGYGGSGEKVPENIPKDIPATIGKIIGAGLAFIGIAFFILMIYGGFLWMFARGNEQEVTKAKDLIYQAVIGLIIVLAAYAITVYVSKILTL